MSFSSTPKKPKGRRHRRSYFFQRRMGSLHHLYPHRWNWTLIAHPLDQSLGRSAQEPLTAATQLGLRYFWLHGVFNAIGDGFYLSFIPLFALAYGASNGQVGWLAAVANLLGALSLFPGAQVAEKLGRRKPLVVWSFGTFGRLMVLGLACLPFLGLDASWVLILLIALNGLRAFADNFSNPAWTALVADLVPTPMRGRYFSQRNIAMGTASLLIVPFSGWLINVTNNRAASDLLGYQIVFLLAVVAGLCSRWSFTRIPEPEVVDRQMQQHQRGELRRALKQNPEFVGLVISAFIWNIAVQVAGPFFNIYLVNELQASLTTIGLLASVSSLAALGGQRFFSRLVDRRGPIRVQLMTGFLIPVVPLAWLLVTAPWQVTFINATGGLLWAGYNLANFNLLLELTPDEQRPQAVALFQTVVFASAVCGPMLGGYLADLVSYQLIFILSGVGRLVGITCFLLLAARPALRKGRGIPLPANQAD